MYLNTYMVVTLITAAQSEKIQEKHLNGQAGMIDHRSSPTSPSTLPAKLLQHSEYHLFVMQVFLFDDLIKMTDHHVRTVGPLPGKVKCSD